MALQRPPTLKEIVMRSLLGWREPADTIVDAEDERTTEIPSLPEEPRPTLISVVFDLCGPPRAEAKSSP
jgi:hypothetical protein